MSSEGLRTLVASDKSGHHRMLSVIVPVYNDTTLLRQCLAALAVSRYDDFDVLVVDDSSPEPVAPLVKQYGFMYMRLPAPEGPVQARNHGAARVHGQYIVFVDVDVCVQADTLARFAERFAEEPSLDAIIGTYDDTPAAPNFLSQYKNILHYYKQQRRAGDVENFWSSCGAIRRELFLAYGGFAEQHYRLSAITDIELGTRLRTGECRVVRDPSIRVKPLKRWTFTALLKDDIVARGVPWVRLLWRTRTLATSLKMERAQHLSVLLSSCAVLAFLSAMRWALAWGGVAGLIIALLAVNSDFYRYLTVRKGMGFTLRVLPLHWLYFGCCGFCIVWGTLLHSLEALRELSSMVSTKGKLHKYKG